MAIFPTHKKSTLLFAALFLVALIVYLPTLFHGFVYDDMEQVLGNPWIVDFTHLGDIFFSASWSFMKETVGSNYYRPVMHLVFLIEYHLFGFNPGAFHLLNIILHSLNSLLVFLVVRALFRSMGFAVIKSETEPEEGLEVRAQRPHSLSATYWAFAAALIFALHPINSEVVNWVSALPELLYTLFLLAAFYIYITLDLNASLRGRALWTALSLIFFFVALLSKETAMVFLLIIWCYDFSTKGASFIRRYLTYIPYIITAVVYMVLRTYALGGFAQKEMAGTGLYGSMVNISPAILRYMGKLLWPANLSVIYVLEPFYSLFEPMVLLSIAVMVLFCFVVLALRRRAVVFFPILWIIIPLLPVLYIPVVSTGGFADRYLYLPSAGFAMIVAVIFHSVSLRTKEGRKAAVIVLFAIFVLYGVFTVKRSMVWTDSMSLWSDTVNTAPESAIVNLGLAAAFRAQGDNEKAIEYYKRVVKLEPFNYKPYYNLALIYNDTNDKLNAAAYYEKTIRLNPLNDKAIFNLAVLYDQAGDVKKAIYFYKETIRVNPLNERARGNLAQAYKKSGNPSAALGFYKEAVAVNPLSSTAHYNLAWSFQEVGDNQSAIDSFKEAVRLEPKNAKALYGLAWVYHYVGSIRLAERYYKETIMVDPKVPDAYFNLGLIYSNSGEFEGAIKNFEKVLEIDPDYREAKARLKRAKSIGRPGK